MESFKHLAFICRNDKSKSFVNKISTSAACRTIFRDYIQSKLKNKFCNIQNRFNNRFGLRKSVNYNSNLFPLYFDFLDCYGGGEVFTIFVRTWKETTIPIDVSKRDTVKEVKLKFETQEKIPWDLLRLVYQGKQLEDNRSLAHYNIRKESTLHMVMRLRGGRIKAQWFADISKQQHSDNQFSKDEPIWRMSRNGLNIEGVCETANCKAYKQQVIHKVGYGIFDLISERFTVECPMCKEYIKPVTCGFTKCNYSIDGVKILPNNEEERYIQDSWKQVGELYRYYDPTKSGMIRWKTLKIITKGFKAKLNNFAERCYCCQEKVQKIDENNLSPFKCKHRIHKMCFTSLKIPLRKSCLIC